MPDQVIAMDRRLLPIDKGNVFGMQGPPSTENGPSVYYVLSTRKLQTQEDFLEITGNVFFNDGFKMIPRKASASRSVGQAAAPPELPYGGGFLTSECGAFKAVYGYIVRTTGKNKWSNTDNRKNKNTEHVRNAIVAFTGNASL